jgi:hypothetical protein
MTPTAVTPAAAKRPKKTGARPPARAAGPRQGNARSTSGAAAATPHRGTARRAPAPRAPRRVSGPAASPRTRPSGTRTTPPRPALGVQALAFLRSLPDHPLFDRIVRGRAWIPLLGVLLAGIVAMQVEVLKLGAGIGRSIERGAQLQSQDELLRASVATLSDDQRIERLAANMGMIMPAPDAVTFLTPRPVGYLQRAASSIHQPDSTNFLATLPATDTSATSTSTATPGVPGGAIAPAPGASGATVAVTGTGAPSTAATGTTPSSTGATSTVTGG